MSAIPDIVDVQITAEIAKLVQQGFGIPLFLSHSSVSAAWTERVRSYTEASQVLTDFPAVNGYQSPEYAAAVAVFSQNPRPPSMLIGRGSLQPTQRYAMTPTVLNSHRYTFLVNGTEYDFTSDASATATEIIAGIKAKIDALALPVTTSDQVTALRVLANAPGGYVAIGSTDPNLRVQEDHADPGVATDLAAIWTADSTWYALITKFNSDAYVMAAAGWANAQKRLYNVQSEDTAIPNTPLSGTDDLGEKLKNAGYDHAALWFSKSQSDNLDAGVDGKCLPYNPGEETWKFKTLAGVPAGSYTPTQRANMRAKNVNFYEPTAGINITEEGIVASGAYIDFIRYQDSLIAGIGEDVFGGLAAPPKVPFNDAGIALIVGLVRARLQADEKRGVILPGWTVTAPLASEVSSINRANRVLPDVKFECVYAGAIHKVQIRGTISL